MLHDILEILIQNNNLKIGSIIRMSRTNTMIREIIYTHQFLWRYKSVELGYKLFHDDIIDRIKHSCRCRECGHKNGLKTMSSNGIAVYICKECTLETMSYNELVCRAQIFKNEGNLWSKKRRIILQGLDLARISRNNKQYYWAYQWNKKKKKMYLPWLCKQMKPCQSVKSVKR